MRFSLLSQAIGGATLVAGFPGSNRQVTRELGDLITDITDDLAPLLPISGMGHNLVPLDQAIEKFADVPKADSDPATYNDTATPEELRKGKGKGDFATESISSTSSSVAAAAAAACASSPNIRYEWDDYSTANRQALMSAFKCLQNKPPSGAFSVSKSRWEDFARLHQQYTPNVHQNAKFLPWHRYFLWSFEQALRDECGFTAPFVWFDETKHTGAFSSSDLFSSAYLGSLGGASHCVTDGAFAGLTVNVGPGTGNSPHCLSREGSASDTAQCSTAYVNSCLSNDRYQDFEKCFELGPHGYGHNGVGGVMKDVYASPAEPFFWFHHAFVDRAWRIWELANPNTRYSSIDGTDASGNPVSLDTPIYLGGIRPDTTIRQVIDTLSNSPLCYRYNY